MIAIWIEPHERIEALAAYQSRLTHEMIRQIENAPATAIIQVFFNICGDPTMNSVQIIPEG